MTGSASALCAGFIALDVVQTVGGTWLRAGGTAANVAASLAFLGWRSGVIGVIGDDDAGRMVRADLERVGVDASALELRRDVVTPIVLHMVQETGHRYAFGCRTCGRPYAPHRPTPSRRMLIEPDAFTDVFFFDRPSRSAIALATAYRSAGKLVYYEPSTASREAMHARAAAVAHVIKYSAERAPFFETALAATPEGQLRIVTLGSGGSRWQFGSDQWIYVDAPSVEVVDAGGAGDWFSAALLTRLQGRLAAAKVERALNFAHGIAALACLVPGARGLSDALDRDAVIRRARALRGGRVPRIGVAPNPEPLASDTCTDCLLPVRSLSA